jgi:peptidoglycan hydrolase-like protein with peptidoglycan-binding domain
LFAVGEGSLRSARLPGASRSGPRCVPLNMRRSLLVFLCVVTWAMTVGIRAGSLQAQAATGTSTLHASTSKKSSKKRRKTRFVPKQTAPTADRVSEIQTALAHGGYYQGDPNGKWDSSTVAAMQKFQSANGIEATGKIDAPSLQKLGLGSDIAGVSAPHPPVPVGKTPQSSAPAAQSPTASNASASSGDASIAASANSITSKTPQQ